MSALFSRETFDFLVENRLRDDKAWFQANKDRYQRHVVEPLAALLGEIAPAMLAVDDQLVLSPKVGGSISRIWRDTRFSKDKSLFRDSMWLSMLRQKGVMLPEFFFVITPQNYLYGCGYYAASSAAMQSIREMMLAGSPDFLAARQAYEAQSLFEIEGEMYKRDRYPDAPEDLKPWLNRKTISLMRTSDDFDLLYSDRLGQTLAGQFGLIAPMYRFLLKAEERVRKE